VLHFLTDCKQIHLHLTLLQLWSSRHFVSAGPDTTLMLLLVLIPLWCYCWCSYLCGAIVGPGATVVLLLVLISLWCYLETKTQPTKLPYSCTVLLYGAEAYRRHIRKLEQFHMRCLRRLADMWQDKKPNTEVRELCNITGIEALLINA